MGRTCSKCGADLSRPLRRHVCRKPKVIDQTRQITFLPRDMKVGGLARSSKQP
jgi:hypothetical protein